MTKHESAEKLDKDIILSENDELNKSKEKESLKKKGFKKRSALGWTLVNFILGLFLVCIPIAYIILFAQHKEVKGMLTETKTIQNNIKAENEKQAELNSLLLQLISLNSKAYRNYSQSRYESTIEFIEESIELLNKFNSDKEIEKWELSAKKLLAENYLLATISYYRLDKHKNAPKILNYTNMIIDRLDSLNEKAYGIRGFAKHELGKSIEEISSDFEFSIGLKPENNINTLNLSEQFLVHNNFNQARKWAKSFYSSYDGEKIYGTRNGLYAYHFILNVTDLIKTKDKKYLRLFEDEVDRINKTYSEKGYWEFDITENWINNINENKAIDNSIKEDIIKMYNSIPK